MPSRDHHRPATPGAAFFEALPAGLDPEERQRVADRTATVLVRGASQADDAEVAERVMGLADAEGLESLADLWSHSAPDSLAGALWRLYVVRAWIHADPHRAATAFEAGQGTAQVSRVIAGVSDPPTPDSLCATIDDVMRGIVHGAFVDVLWRAAAVVHVLAAGQGLRQSVGTSTVREAARLMSLAEQLEGAGHLEDSGRLH